DPLVDATGRFTGFRGTALPEAGVSTPAPAPAALSDPAFGSLPLSDPAFGRRIDGALRGPLARIIATAETISGQFDGPIRADYARYAGDIAHAGRHLLGLVDDLADLQNIERPGFKAARDEIDLGDLARRAVGLLGMKAEEKGIRIDAPPTDERMPATGEFRRVLQVLLNLLGNAIRYSPENSLIWIRLDRQGDRAMVTVADQGQGIDAGQQAVVFEKFERLGRTDSGGSGLGLYIARRLARAMEGDLTVDSAPGQGARFTLSLPARDGV
ncbi:MAG: sensor histidine kinase, partial [Sphingopyxis solisilvae]|uniref:sensor histidine kinase n=1 Tax=Sphingopyxis solisilvae TaxID=1886788 RepID=UPI004036EBB9